MAEFGIKATQMSAADTGAAKFVRQPTQDTSSNVMLGTVLGVVAEGAKFAEGAYDRANVRQLASDIEATAGEYKTRQEAPGQLAQASTQEAALEDLWKTTSEEDLRTMTPENFWKGAEEIGKVQTSIDTTLEKYKKAYEQGRMSSDELINRVNSATKAAIARQPGLARELVSQASFYQQLSGVTDQIEAEKAFEKDRRDSAQKRIEEENKVLIEWGKNPNTIPPQQRAQVVAEVFKRKEDVQRLDAVKKSMEVLDSQGKLQEKIVDQVFSSPEHIALFSSDLAQSHNTITTNLASKGYESLYPNMNPADAKLRGITEEFAAKRNQLVALSSRGSDKSKRIADAQIKQYDDMEKLYKDIALGGPAATAAKQALEARQAGLQLTTASLEHRLSLTNQLTAAISNLGNAGMKIIDPNYYQGILDPLVRDTQNFTMGIGPSPLSTLDYTNKDGQVAGKFIFSSQNPVNDPLRTSDEVVASNNINMRNNLNMLRQTEDPVKFMQAMDVWTQTVVQEAVTSGEPLSTRYSPETVAEVNKFLGDAFANARTSGTLSYDRAANSFIVLNEDGAKNAERSKRVNTMFKAFLSFNGHKTDAKIDEVANVLQRLASGPLAIKNLSDARDAFTAGRLSEEEYKYITKNLPKGQQVERPKPVEQIKKEEKAATTLQKDLQTTINAERYLAEREAIAEEYRQGISDAFNSIPNVKAISWLANKLNTTRDEIFAAEKAYREGLRAKAGIKQ